MLAKTTPKEAFTHYLRKHVLTYTILSVMLILGVIFGALSAKVLPDEEKSELAQDLTAFFRGFGETMQVAAVSASQQGFYGNLKTVFIGWLLGLSVIGAPGIGVLLFLRGFTIGFTVGFLVLQMASRGVLLAFVSVLPQNLFIIPALILSFESSLTFAKIVIEDRFRSTRIPLYPQFLLSCITLVGALALLGIASIVEGFITPVFIELISRHM
ncbi:MAG: stage II sporulation protein M [Bacillota bacterium]|jgi:stage II sporulation protein M|nr:stage II sporulation protein M [Bacillota bacterium]MDI9415838.1 stage II sporulation protein M [Bacillota bacterium]NLD12415.1 stage II sporulation protein M [Bacillota bacterium]HAV21744.1 stage II sporulation protein M [Bacillota bacterium]HOB88034.1 stage II sporulation protein M [Bacillota bacterium]